MDDAAVRKLGFLLAEQARVFGMLAENEANKLLDKPQAYDADAFFAVAFTIDNIARE